MSRTDEKVVLAAKQYLSSRQTDGGNFQVPLLTKQTDKEAFVHPVETPSASTPEKV